MTTIAFLKKLHREHQISLIEPSKEIAQAYFLRSEKSLSSAKLVKNAKNFEDATSLTYYSMYYTTLALFFRCGIKCENHTAAVMLLEEVCDIDGKALAKAKKERIDKQYYIAFSATTSDVEALIRVAEQFNSTILDVADRFTPLAIVEIRKKFALLVA